MNQLSSRVQTTPIVVERSSPAKEWGGGLGHVAGHRGTGWGDDIGSQMGVGHARQFGPRMVDGNWRQQRVETMLAIQLTSGVTTDDNQQCVLH